MKLKSRIIFLKDVKEGKYSIMGGKPSLIGRIVNLAVDSEEEIYFPSLS